MFAHAQTETYSPPFYPGGEIELEKYLSPLNAQHLLSSQRPSKELVAHFQIDVKGKSKKISILRGLDFGSNYTFYHLIKNMPAWKPASCNGFTKPQYVTLKVKV
ncbi:MAG: hypothetical protein AAF696_19660 [Bacteroidota bacterium]